MTDRAQAGFDLNRPTIVSLLYLLGIFTAAPTIIAVVLAYVWRGDVQEPWEASHYRFHIRSFWMGLAWIVAGLFTTLLGVGGVILLLVPVWLAGRCVVALAAAQRREPIANPDSWFW